MNIPLPAFVIEWINRNKKLWLIAAYAAVIAHIEGTDSYTNWIRNDYGDSFMLLNEDLVAVLVDRLSEVRASINE